MLVYQPSRHAAHAQLLHCHSCSVIYHSAEQSQFAGLLASSEKLYSNHNSCTVETASATTVCTVVQSLRILQGMLATSEFCSSFLTQTIQKAESFPRSVPSRVTLPTQRRANETMLKFSQICVDSILDNPAVNLGALVSSMKALGHQHVADFVTRCHSGTQVIIAYSSGAWWKTLIMWKMSDYPSDYY